MARSAEPYMRYVRVHCKEHKDTHHDTQTGRGNPGTGGKGREAQRGERGEGEGKAKGEAREGGKQGGGGAQEGEKGERERGGRKQR